MGKFREKLLDFKHRLQDRKMYSIVILVIAVITALGIYQYKRVNNMRQLLNNQYNRSFYDMVGYVNNVETLLMKSMVSGTPERTASSLQEAWRQAYMAQTNLGQLPVNQPVLANTSKFLTQLGDLAFTLNRQSMDGKAIDQKQYETLQKLHGYAVSLNNSLGTLQTQISTGRIKWDELEKKGTPVFKKTSAELPIKQFENLNKTFQEYPTLIYDGPFSEHIARAEAKGLSGEKITPEKGNEAIKKFFGADKIKSIKYVAKNDGNTIKTYSYTVYFNNVPDEQSASLDLTQKGGQVMWMLYNRPTAGEKIDMNKAKEIGRKFLESRGFKNMVDTYYIKEDSVATINYAYQQDKVVVYPDLIKVKVALDNGEIVGFESKGYLMSHIADRKLPTPKVSLEQARKAVSSRVEVKSSGMAIIPTDYTTEIFTYEFKGKVDDQDFLVYVNAETGKEENILMIINTPNGILTM